MIRDLPQMFHNLRTTAVVSAMLALSVLVGHLPPSYWVPLLVGGVYVLREWAQTEAGDLAMVPPMFTVIAMVYLYEQAPYASASAFMVGMSLSWAVHANASTKSPCTQFLLAGTIGTMTDTLVYCVSAGRPEYIIEMQAIKWLPILVAYATMRVRRCRTAKTL